MSYTEQQIAILILLFMFVLSLFVSKRERNGMLLSLVEEREEAEKSFLNLKLSISKLKEELKIEKETVSVLKQLIKLDPEMIVKKITELTQELKKYKALYFDMLEDFEKLQAKKSTDKSHLQTLEKQLKELKAYIKDKEFLTNGLLNPDL